MARRKLDVDVHIPAGTEIDDLMGGFPGTHTQATQPPNTRPAMVEVEINGAKYMVPADSAEAIKASNAAVSGQFAQMRTELDALKTRTAPAPAPQLNADDELETQLFLDPKAALKRHADQIKADMRNEYTLEQRRAQWWEDFYKEYKHLKPAAALVEAVMAKNFTELSKVAEPQQAKALADKADAVLAGVIKETAPTQNPRQTSAPVERGSVTRTEQFQHKVEEEYPTDRVVSIGERIRKQNQRRLNARTGRTSA